MSVTTHVTMPVTAIMFMFRFKLRFKLRFRVRFYAAARAAALGAKKSISLLDMGFFSKKICTLLLVEIIISKVINDKSFPLNRKEQIKTRGN